MKNCSKCKKSLSFENFGKDKSSSSGLSSQCKTCRRETHKKYRKKMGKKRKNSKEVNSKYNKSEKGKLRTRRFRKKNKLSCTMRTYISDKIKQSCGKKSGKLTYLLGCSIEFLKEHLESQFQPGMSWDNYGNPSGDHSEGWHIDHIRPCSSFDLTDPEQQKECFNWRNLQPLWGLENLSKGAKF